MLSCLVASPRRWLCDDGRMLTLYYAQDLCASALLISYCGNMWWGNLPVGAGRYEDLPTSQRREGIGAAPSAALGGHYRASLSAQHGGGQGSCRVMHEAQSNGDAGGCYMWRTPTRTRFRRTVGWRTPAKSQSTSCRTRSTRGATIPTARTRSADGRRAAAHAAHSKLKWEMRCDSCGRANQCSVTWVPSKPSCRW